MADGLTLKREERRLRWTVAAGAACLMVSTVGVSDTRALFNPLAQATAEPSAYAFLLPEGHGGTGALAGAGGGHHRPAGRRHASNPVAYAARVPGDAAEAPQPRAAGAPAPAAAPLQPEGIELASNAPGDLVLPTSGGGGSPGFPGTDLGPPTIGGPGIDSPGVGPGTGGGDDPGPDPTSPVPEPSTWATMILGFGLLGFFMLRRMKPAQAA